MNEEVTPSPIQAGGSSTFVDRDPVNWSKANWMMGLGYVWFFAGIAAFTPFTAIYYKGLGFSGVQVGVLAAMPAIALILTGTMWGAISDAYAAHRWMLRISLALGAMLAFVSSRLDTFPTLLIGITLLSFSIVPLRSLFDHYAVLIGEHVGRHFGRIRLWGAFGYTAFALTLGRAMNTNVTSLFLVAYGISLVLALVSTWGLPETGIKRHEPLVRGIRDVLRHRQFVLLLIVAWAQAATASLIVANLGIHIKGLGGSTAQVGAAFAIAAISELPVFWAGQTILSRLGVRSFIGGLLALYAIRMLLLSIVSAPVGVILLQSLHGVTFGAFLIVGVPAARRLAGRHYPATAQAVFTMAAYGLGYITGAMVAGSMLDVTTTATVYRWTAAFMAVVVVLYLAGTRNGEAE